MSVPYREARDRYDTGFDVEDAKSWGAENRTAFDGQDGSAWSGNDQVLIDHQFPVGQSNRVRDSEADRFAGRCGGNRIAQRAGSAISSGGDDGRAARNGEQHRRGEQKNRNWIFHIDAKFSGQFFTICTASVVSVRDWNQASRRTVCSGWVIGTSD